MITGYTKELAEYVKQKGRYFASCKGCTHLDVDEVCSNPNVTKYDVMVEDGRQFCIFWQPERGN